MSSKKSVFLIGVSSLAFAAVGVQAQETPLVLPEQPNAFQTVLLNDTGLGAWCPPEAMDVSMADNVITVQHHNVPCQGFAIVPSASVIRLGSFPAGEYHVRVVDRFGELYREGSFEVTALAVDRIGDSPFPAAPVGGASYTDAWFDHDEPGSGLLLYAPENGVVFGVLMTYDAAGEPDWFLLGEGEWSGCNAYRSSLYRTTGSSILADYDPAARSQEVVGEVTLQWPRVDWNRREGHCIAINAWNDVDLVITVGDTTVRKLYRRTFEHRE